MSGKLFYLDDRRFHNVRDPGYQEICTLPNLEPGPSLVIAKGTVRGEGVEFNVGIRFRLEVHAIFSGLVGFDETEFFTEPANIGPGGVLVTSGNPDRNTFALLVAATLPFEGGAGSGPPPPPHRAVLVARKETASDGVGVLTNVKIAVYPFDEIVATVLSDPDQVPVGPDDQHPK